MPTHLVGEGQAIESNIPARLDRLPWSRRHLVVVIALGITWLLDGLETTLGGAFVGILKDPKALGLTDEQIGLPATAYLAGAVAGALVFGSATDRLGRKRLFFTTLGLNLLATAASARGRSPARASEASMRRSIPPWTS